MVADLLVAHAGGWRHPQPIRDAGDGGMRRRPGEKTFFHRDIWNLAGDRQRAVGIVQV